MNKILIILVLIIGFISCKEEVKQTNTKIETTSKIAKDSGNSTKEVVENSKNKLEGKKPKTTNRLIKNRLKKRELKANKKNRKNSELEELKNLELKESDMVNKGNGIKTKNTYEFASYDLPDACELLPAEWLASNFNINSADILVKDASSAKSKFARSCFFKWSVPSVANGGIMLQLQKNPVPDLTKSWVTGFLSSKRSEGESSMNTPGMRMTYKDLPGLGDEAVYNYDLNRCYWRVGEDQLFLLAFNLGQSEAIEKAQAVKIGNQVIKNFKKIKK